MHTTGGYLLGAALTVKYVFDVHPDDRFACMADIGWITGHTYIVYGPLLNGVTTLVFESTPVYPSPARYWEAVQAHRLTQFYSAPTAIRLLRRLGAHHVAPWDLSSLRVLGSVGEPINPEAWNWYNEHVGRGQCAIVDTFWQTETGSIVVTPFPGAVETKPGAATVPFFGIEPAILDPATGVVRSPRSTDFFLFSYFRAGVAREQRGGRAGAQEPVALGGAHDLGRPPALPRDVHGAVPGAVLHGRRRRARRARVHLDQGPRRRCVLRFVFGCVCVC